MAEIRMPHRTVWLVSYTLYILDFGRYKKHKTGSMHYSNSRKHLWTDSLEHSVKDFIAKHEHVPYKVEVRIDSFTKIR